MTDLVQRRVARMLPAVIVAATMAACSGSGLHSSLPSGQSPVASASSTNIQVESEAAAMQQQPVRDVSTATVSATPVPISVHYGQIIGLDDTFSPVDGNTNSGGNGTAVEGVPCDNGSIPYHIHAHLSLLINGRRLSIPDAIGLHNPGTESNGLTFATICYYHLHTHDATGLIHIEGPAQAAFTLGQLFAVWGQPLSSTNVAGNSGSVQAFVATARTPGWAQQTGPYSPYTGDLQQLPLASHQEIVLEVGPTFVLPPDLPAIIFPTYQ